MSGEPSKEALEAASGYWTDFQLGQDEFDGEKLAKVLDAFSAAAVKDAVQRERAAIREYIQAKYDRYGPVGAVAGVMLMTLAFLDHRGAE